jgi:MtrB/PioB family decaheme-associated outer membrane protein
MKARDTLRMAGMAAALMAAFDTAHAQRVEVEVPFALNVDASKLGIGLGYALDDAPRFGMYNGITQEGYYGLFDFNLVDRNDATGAWHWLSGRNLGLDSPQLRFEYSEQGNWGYYLDYSKITRNEPWSVTTAVGGIGTPDLTIPVAPVTGSPLELRTKREAIGVGFDKFLYGNWDLQVRFRNEEKEGARLFARGSTGAGPAGSFGAFEFAPEPINSATRQIEAKLRYTGSQLQLAGGYYGTAYNNEYKGLNFTGGLAALSTFTPIALPPDNQSQQLYLSGGYGFTPTTRGNFKLAYAKATQEDSFVTGVNVPLAPGVGSNLMGRVDTTLVQAGITSRPIPKLTLLADLRYEDRDDKTPVVLYNTLAGPTSTFNGENEPRSILAKTAKAEASYALPASFRLTGGIGYEEKKRNVSAVRVVSARETTEETSYRLELRRMMSETVTGALSYVHSDRDGSPFLQTTLNNGTPGSNLIAPIHLADRKRDKARLSINWAPIEPLNLQFFVDVAKDSYSGRDGSDLGVRKGDAQNYSIDAAYTFSERLQATAWYSRNNTNAEQATCVGASSTGVCPGGASPIWGATLQNLSNSFGVGVRDKPQSDLEVGADLSYSDITDEYRQETISGAAVASLPNVSTQLTRLNLFARHAFQKNSGVRIDYILDRFKTNDWTWSNWMYADGTRVTQDPNQLMTFFGVSYYYRFQ